MNVVESLPVYGVHFYDVKVNIFAVFYVSVLLLLSF